MSWCGRGIKNCCKTLQCQGDEGCLDNSCLADGKYFWAFAVLLAFYAFVFSEMVIGAQGANLHYTMNVSTESNCTDAFNNVRVYFLLEAVFLITHSGIWFLYALMGMIFAIGCCGVGFGFRVPEAFSADDQETGQPMVPKQKLRVGTDGFKLHVWVLDWFRSMFGYGQTWFVLIWELMIVAVLGMCAYGLWVNAYYYDKRYCAPSVWDTFYFHLLYILCFSLALLAFIAITVIFVFNFSNDVYLYDIRANDERRVTINTVPVPNDKLKELRKEYNRGPYVSTWVWVDYGDSVSYADQYKAIFVNISYDLLHFIEKNYNPSELPRQDSDDPVMGVEITKS